MWGTAQRDQLSKDIACCFFILSAEPLVCEPSASEVAFKTLFDLKPTIAVQIEFRRWRATACRGL
jgi:hypothetical protein